MRRVKGKKNAPHSMSDFWERKVCAKRGLSTVPKNGENLESSSIRRLQYTVVLNNVLLHLWKIGPSSPLGPASIVDWTRW